MEYDFAKQTWETVKEDNNFVIEPSREALFKAFMRNFIDCQHYGAEIYFEVLNPLKDLEPQFHMKWNFSNQEQWNDQMLLAFASELYSFWDAVNDDADFLLTEEDEANGVDCWYSLTDEEKILRYVWGIEDDIRTIQDPSLWDARLSSLWGTRGDTKITTKLFRDFPLGENQLWEGLRLEKAFKSMKLTRLKAHFETCEVEAMCYIVAKINEKCYDFVMPIKERDILMEDVYDWIAKNNIKDKVLDHPIFHEDWIITKHNY